MYSKHIRAILHYLTRVVPKGAEEERELTQLIEYLRRRIGDND